MSRNLDSWDDELGTTLPAAPGSTSNSRNRVVSKAAAVVDDWELDDDEEEADIGRSVDVQNKRIWEDANTKPHHPMPSLVISRGTSSTVVAPSLPLNQPPTMRILKRPTDSGSSSPSGSSTNLSSTLGETFQEREARYQAARERIFGTSSPDLTTDSGDKRKSPTGKKLTPTSSPTATPPPSANKVVRDPRGPTNISDNNNNKGKTESKGFDRTKRPPPPSTAPHPTAEPNSTPDTAL